jgi:hypothetical protein
MSLTDSILAEADVLICGAGLAGCVTAIASARNGAKTILLERSGMLGGVVTASFMNSMSNMFFNDEDIQVIRGIPSELIEEGVRRGIVSPKWRTNEYRQIRFEVEEFHKILLDKLDEAGVTIYTHAWATHVIQNDDAITGAEVQTRAGRKIVKTRILVDASGDLDVSATCKEDPTLYEPPGMSTLLFELYGVNMQESFEFFLNNPDNYIEKTAEGVSFEAFQRNWIDRGLFHIQHYGGVAIKPLQDAIIRGEYAKEIGLAKKCDALAMFGTKDSGRVLINSNFFYLDELEHLDQFSRAELEVRDICMKLYRVLKKVLPGFQNAVLTHIGSELGCRKVRRLDGKFTMHDINYAQQYDDVVGVVPVVDQNAPNGFFGHGNIDLPFGMLVPKKIDNLLIGSAKNFSCIWNMSRLFLRYQPVCMLTGQIAGTAAAYAVRTKTSIHDIDIKELQMKLHQQDVFLGGETRLSDLGIR